MKKLKKHMLINTILVIFFLSFFSQLHYSRAQPSDASLIVSQSFRFFEFTESKDELTNITSVSIPLPASTWNLTDIELNFTDIKLGREVITIEDQDYDTNSLYYINKNFKRLGLSVQISLSETTKIFGVYIKGRNSSLISQNVRVQIRGYNEIEKKPNTTLYADIPLNMSSESNWYYQNFSSFDLKLPKGNYSLVLDGSEITSTTSRYYWYINEINPLIPYLHTSEYVNSWSTGLINSTFLYKLVQRRDRIYNPTELNMTIELNGQKLLVSENGTLTIKNLNYCPNSENLEMSINLNRTIVLLFNLNYHLHLKSMFITELGQGSVSIKDGRNNFWSIFPTINRICYNYSIKFYYPSDWINISIYRDNNNVTSEILFNKINYYITILNNSFIGDHVWKIQASSPQTEFDLYIWRTEYNPGQEIRVSIKSSAPIGNYTFVLYDADDWEVGDARQTISYPLDEDFSFILSTGAFEGEYHGYVYFFDGINAGVETVLFTVKVPFSIDLFLLLLIIITSGIGIASTISIVFAVKKHKRKVEAYKKAIYDKCMDILNLNYIMVSEKKASLNVYEQVFTKQNIDPTLIAGFLSAIHSFGIELTNSIDQTQTIKLEYKNSKVIMAEFRDFRIVLIMNESPSQKFLESLNNLAFDIELYFSRYLKTFKGNIEPFRGIEDLLKKHLGISFLYPLHIVKDGKTKINPIERLMIGRALDLMKKNKQKYFYTTHIMEKNAYDSKEIKAIFSLIDKKIFQPVI